MVTFRSYPHTFLKDFGRLLKVIFGPSGALKPWGFDMIHPATADRLTADEKHEIHNARVVEFQNGEISGKEFVQSLMQQCGFHELDAKEQWQSVRDNCEPRIYSVQAGDDILYPVRMSDLTGETEWRKGRVSSFYAMRVGAIVDIGNGLKLPFSLFELRVAK